MSVGRPLQFDPEQALEAALDVFWTQGYELTSLQDLLREMGLSKSSFYQAFGSKHELFERCLARYREAMLQTLERDLAAADSAWDFLEQTLHSAALEAGGPDVVRRGCFTMNAAAEFAQRDSVVAAEVGKCVAGLVELFGTAIQRGQAEGTVVPDRAPDVLARYLVSNLGGLKTMIKAGAGETEVRQVIEVVLSALQTQPAGR